MAYTLSMLLALVAVDVVWIYVQVQRHPVSYLEEQKGLLSTAGLLRRSDLMPKVEASMADRGGGVREAWQRDPRLNASQW